MNTVSRSLSSSDCSVLLTSSTPSPIKKSRSHCSLSDKNFSLLKDNNLVSSSFVFFKPKTKKRLFTKSIEVEFEIQNIFNQYRNYMHSKNKCIN